MLTTNSINFSKNLNMTFFSMRIVSAYSQVSSINRSSSRLHNFTQHGNVYLIDIAQPLR